MPELDLYIDPGKHRQVFDIELSAETRTAAGGIRGTGPWSLFVTNRGWIKPSSGREAFMGGEFLAEVTHEIEMRWYRGIVPKMRVNFMTQAQRDAKQEGRLFDILDVIDVEERHIKIVMACKEIKRSKGI